MIFSSANLESRKIVNIDITNNSKNKPKINHLALPETVKLLFDWFIGKPKTAVLSLRLKQHVA